MAAKEIKNELKSARDCLNNKDFQAALKHCKAVLKLDKTNYNAFVFVGVASIELGKPEQAQAAYKKAIQVNPENVLAWQGLASLHEKEPEFGDKEDMIEVYERLSKHYERDDTKKWADFVLKLFELHKSLNNFPEAWELLKLLQEAEFEAKDQHLLWCKIITLLEENKDVLSPEQRNELVNGYRHVLHDQPKPTDEVRNYFENYIKLLLDQKRDSPALSVKEIITEAKRMKQLFEKDDFVLNVLAKLYLEDILAIDEEEAVIYAELLALNPESPLALFGLGKLKLFEQDFAQAEELLMSGLQVLHTSCLAWYFLSQVHTSHHEYENVLSSCTKALENINKDDILYNRDLLCFHLSFTKAKACGRLPGSENISAAVEQLQELLTLQPDNVDIRVELGRIFVKSNDLEAAKKCLEDVLMLDTTTSKRLVLEGEIQFAEGYLEAAERSFCSAIEVQQDLAESYLNLGKVYWQMDGEWRTEKDKCLGCLLKAVKSDSYNSSSFLYLGHYYQTVGLDINKALRCYQKAHSLNPLCGEAAEALGDLYMSLGQEDAAAELYKKFTSKAGVGRAKWVFLRLGLCHLKQEQYNDAVKCLQNALRVDVKDANTWECLGEAYMSRGSHNPALASFTEATELNPSLLYSRYQIAVIKHLLGLFDEAVLVYNTILAEHCDYVPALKGLGESYISYARSSLHQDFHDRAMDYIQKAVDVLARAIQCDGSLSCLWKLLGDVCSLVFKIHENKIRIELPENFRTFQKLQEGKVGKIELLSLAASSFGQAVRHNASCASLWHDVGLSYFRMSTIHQDSNERQRLCERAMKALKKSLKMEPRNYITWNTLGIVAASNDVNNPELSQHSFIKSIQSQKNPVAWTNLGVLYLRYGKADMANVAFNTAQCTDPSYAQAWIGQATIAEMFGHEEAMDLYRHSHELGAHVESYLGYAHWVCHTLLSISKDQDPTILKGKPFADLSHLPRKLRNIVLIASVALTKYTDQIQDNPCALNMHGVLLEHQELYGQAEDSYNRSLQLLESCENQQHCNIVRANYARVLCYLGKYSESVKLYQEIKPLSDFYHVTGLALAFFKLGKPQQSYQAYEQAYELATNASEKSHVRAAMGMVRYVSGDEDGSKEALFESSQLSPASKQGLLALSSLGLISSDISLAALVLAELVKVGQRGDERLVAEASYLFASFYALQGSPVIGKSYIVKEIHRRPHSSLLWNNLAKFILRFQPNNLKEAGRCAQVAHRLGDKNVEDVSTTYAYSALGSGHDLLDTTAHSDIPKISRGVVAAQKAVHMNPDSLANWSLLSAAVTAANQRGRQSSKYQLSETLTNFSLSKAIAASESAVQTPDVLKNRDLNIREESKKWLALHYGYCLYYSGKTDEAIQHCQQALELWNADSSFTARIKLLLVETSSRDSTPDNSECLQDVTEVLALNQNNSYAWLFSALFHEKHGMIKAAEWCYRNCLQLASTQGSLHGEIISLIRLAHLALRQAMTQTNSTHWVELVDEASCEVLKLVPSSHAAILLLGISRFLRNHIRHGKDAMCMISEASSKDVAKFYLVLLNLKKPDKGDTVDDVICKATRENTANTLQDVLLYFMAMNVDGSARKRLLVKCVHLNPSEPRFWKALRNL